MRRLLFEGDGEFVEGLGGTGVAYQQLILAWEDTHGVGGGIPAFETLAGEVDGQRL